MAEAETMRGIVLIESITGGQFPQQLYGHVHRIYPHLLGGHIPVRVATLMVRRELAVSVALELTQLLLPRRFYAHLYDEQLMYVVFPRTLVQVHRDDPASVFTAQHIGELFDIPREQMRFDELFVTGHPGLPSSGKANA